MMTPDEMLDKMSFQEIVQAAKEGNRDAVHAIYVIGIGYTCPGEQQDFEYAKTCLELVVDLGSVEAAWEAMKLYKIGAYARMNLCKWEEAIAEIGSVQKMASIVFNDDDFADGTDEKSGKDRFDIAEEYFREADYDMLICLMALEKEEKALSWLDNIKPDHLYYEKYRVLRGILLFSAAAKNREVLQAAYNELRVVEPDSAYVPKKTEILNNFDEVQYEQINYMRAAWTLADMYRLGIPGILAVNVNHAHDILESALSKLSDPDCKKSLEEELSHYKKKLFGGFQYLQ
ncbi:MAG: hypothetical protein NC121_03030 [Blautia sp.]|nr:hypothetical protein [Blautia sp.]